MRHALDEVDIDDYVAMVLPSGPGPVSELYQDLDLGRLLAAAGHGREAHRYRPLTLAGISARPGDCA